MVICSGIFTSFITFLYSFLSSASGIFFFSLSLALLTAAKLLCLISISSTFRALETVNLKSLLSMGVLSFNLLFPVGLSSFFMNAFVACCSTNFLLNFFPLFPEFLRFWSRELIFLKFFDGLKEFFLSFGIEYGFFISFFDRELVSTFFLKFGEIVNVFFFSFYLSITYLNTIFLADIIN